jgi:tetratricopeptide (TPR) repeat protein
MEAGAVVAERFVIEARAGAGGMATVYRAHDRQTNTVVALKLLEAVAERERFVREAELLAHLSHPNIVKYVAHGEMADGQSFLAMEWLEGESLSDRLKREEMSVDDALRLCARIAAALGHAHAHGVVHRDVKPSNLMLPKGGTLDEVRVLDFGIARQGVRRDLTRTGMLVGTPGYMAPEQARGARDVDPRADVFALGCVLYKALTTRAPFAGGSVVAVLAKILLEEPTPIRRVRADIPEHVERLIGTLLSKDPALRPADGNAAAALLEQARSERSETPAPAPAPSESLTAFEQRMLAVLLLDVGVAPVLSDDAEVTATIPPLADPVRVYANKFGVVPEPLADGSILVAFRGAGAEQTARAAKCAIAIAEAMPRCLGVLGTGRALVHAGVPVGDLIDRVASLRASATMLHTGANASRIVVDGVSATLLEERFVLASEGGLQILRGERDAGEPVRTLLGKPSPCVGRERELGELEAVFEECVDEDAPRAVLLKAPSGFGKSRVRFELLAKIKGRAQIWTGRGDPMSVGAPLDLVTQAVRRAYGLRADDAPETKLDKLRARVARHVPEAERAFVTEFIGEIVGAPSETPSAKVRAARADPVLMGDQVRAAVRTLLRAEAAAYPLVLVLEDLHWGDIPTVKLVDSLLGDLGVPLFVLATARPEIDELFPKLWEDHAVLVLPLRELGKRAGEELVRSVLGETSDEMVKDLVARAGGNAFYLEELIRAVAQGDASSLPETVLATVAARLDKLDPDARRVLRAASVFGQAFWRGGVSLLVSDEVGTAAWLDALAAQEIVQRRPESRFDRDPEYVFRHSFVREAAYATLTEGDRATGHRLAGAWLSDSGETNAVVLAEHFERGKEPARAAVHWERAAELAMEANDLTRAIELAGNGLACEPPSIARARLGVIRSEAHRWRGELAQSRIEAKAATESAPEDSSVWYQAVSQLAYASMAAGDTDTLVAIGDKLLGKASNTTDLGTNDAFLVALSRLATSLAFTGRTELADRVHEKMDAALALAVPGEAALARVRLSTAMRAIRLEDDQFTLACFAAALEVFERIGDRRGGMYVRVNLGVIQMGLGDLESAEKAFKEANLAGIATGVVAIAIGARVNLGLLRAYLGSPDEGLALVRETIEAYAHLGDGRMMGIARTYAAIILLVKGDAASAETEAAESAKELEAIPTSRADALATRARALLALKRNDEALASSTEAFGLLAEFRTVDDGAVRIRLAHSEALLACDQVERARALLAESAQRIRERAQKLDPSLAKKFLECVPEVSRLMWLASTYDVA